MMKSSASAGLQACEQQLMTRGTEITIVCPTCGGRLRVRAASAPGGIKCARCGSEVPLVVSGELQADRRVDVCPVCQGRECYVRKDFGPKVGLTIIIIGALCSATLYGFHHDLAAYGVLAAAVLVDLIIYGRLDDVTVCYRCHTEFRGRYARTHPTFDLHVADVLEVEYRRNRSP